MLSFTNKSGDKLNKKTKYNKVVSVYENGTYVCKVNSNVLATISGTGSDDDDKFCYEVVLEEEATQEKWYRRDIKCTTGNLKKEKEKSLNFLKSTVFGDKNLDSESDSGSEQSTSPTLLTALKQYKDKLLRTASNKKQKSKINKDLNNNLFDAVVENVEKIQKKDDLKSIPGLGTAKFKLYGAGVWDVIQHFNKKNGDNP